MNKPSYPLQEIATRLGAELVSADGSNCGALIATGMGTLVSASNSEIAFLANPRYCSQLDSTQALAVIVDPSSVEGSQVHCLVHDDPYQAYAELTQLFALNATLPEGIHETASISASATIGEGARIAAGVVIYDHVSIGSNASIAANTVIEEGVSIGDYAVIAANVSLCHHITLGNDVRISAGSVIGSDGFGYARQYNAESQRVSWKKIAQLGSVEIGDRVEIGANTTIDRGALDNTVIGNDVIIDNQVQVAHNVVIGSGTAIAGCVGIAGSAKIGKNCSIGGGAGIAGHLEIADGSTVMGMTLINRSVNKAGVYASGTGMQEAEKWRKNAVRFTQLEALNKRVKILEKKLQAAQSDDG